MSVQAITWAYRRRVSGADDCAASTVKFVLVTLANYANGQLEVFADAPTLAADTEQSERNVRRALRELEAQKLIVDTGRRRGRTGRVRVWRLLVNADEASAFGSSSLNAAGQSDADRSSGFNADEASTLPGDPNPDGSSSNPDGSSSNPVSLSDPPTTPHKEEPSGNRQGTSSTAAPRPGRARNVAFDRLAEVTGKDPHTLTKNAAREVGTMLADIRDSERRRLDRVPTTDELAEEISVRAHRFPQRYTFMLTPSSLAKYWDTLAGVDTAPQPSNGRMRVADIDWSRFEDPAEVGA